jgi:hypothetical protein
VLVLQRQFLDVFDRDDAIFRRNLEDQRLANRRLARTRGPGKKNVLAQLHDPPQKADDITRPQ